MDRKRNRLVPGWPTGTVGFFILLPRLMELIVGIFDSEPLSRLIASIPDAITHGLVGAFLMGLVLWGWTKDWNDFLQQPFVRQTRKLLIPLFRPEALFTLVVGFSVLFFAAVLSDIGSNDQTRVDRFWISVLLLSIVAFSLLGGLSRVSRMCLRAREYGIFSIVGVVSCKLSQAELTDLIQNKTPIAIRTAIRPHLYTWLSVDGKASDAVRVHGGSMHVRLELPNGIKVSVWFMKWIAPEALAAIRAESHVSVCGRFAEVSNDKSIELENAELLEVRPLSGTED